MTAPTNTHTPASLLALHQQDPRKLDALAALLIMPAPDVNSSAPQVGFNVNTPWCYRDGVLCLFEPSSDLNHAALLEARLAERGLKERYADMLDHEGGLIGDDYDGGSMIRLDILFDRITASARNRTIAAVLTAMEANK